MAPVLIQWFCLCTERDAITKEKEEVLYAGILFFFQYDVDYFEKEKCVK